MLKRQESSTALYGTEKPEEMVRNTDTKPQIEIGVLPEAFKLLEKLSSSVSYLVGKKTKICSYTMLRYGLRDMVLQPLRCHDDYANICLMTQFLIHVPLNISFTSNSIYHIPQPQYNGY